MSQVGFTKALARGEGLEHNIMVNVIAPAAASTGFEEARSIAALDTSMPKWLPSIHQLRRVNQVTLRPLKALILRFQDLSLNNTATRCGNAGSQPDARDLFDHGSRISSRCIELEAIPTNLLHYS